MMNPNEIEKAKKFLKTAKDLEANATIDRQTVVAILEYIKELETEIDKLNIKIDVLGYGLKRATERENSESINAVKEFANNICENRVLNDPVIIAVKSELKKIVGDIE